ncbi:PRTRC system ThiF family protein [Alteromonas macleodii]|uniref:ThiF family protein n=1 Tax=Alteromonas macleodii TaxID=28108 RepID=A0AB36FKB7_ALTMA|nr:PRTRC system ThiF family protein [Alteromonas macleodii]OES24113.1 thiF family protein [Alteromonas macleodii]OES24124.1 thiF family protein [Alteromonas macleodii]OES25886.1 thiF family protein [Alteromonas macleodii]OES38609.1 thiF family protein [Alteromonas macleodii]OES38959.1 thiF family protein [Alteromonas macleodii]
MEFYTPSHMINTRINIAVIGLGGTGSYVLPMLAQMNYLLRCISQDNVQLNVSVYDPDSVSRWNIGRANYYLMDVGKNKANALTERLNLGWGTQWRAHACKFDVSMASRFDVVFTCVDNIQSRLDLGEYHQGQECDTLWIDGGNGSHQGNVMWGHLGNPNDTDKIPNWYDLYAATMEGVEEDVTDSCSHEASLFKQDYGINHITAVLMCQYLWRLMRHGSLTHHVQMFDIAEGDLASLDIDPEMWKTFNYAPDIESVAH